MSSESLALKYRPRMFSEMIGQKLTAVVLGQMVETQTVPSGLLFSGPSGTGKTTAARILSSALDGDVIEVDAASNGGVAEVRTMIDQLRYSSGSEYRVVIYDEAHSMSREAFNALLKTLEEPPAGTIFVLVTTEPEKIPETVLTRLMEFEFRRVPPVDLFDRLMLVSKKEKIEVENHLLHYISQRSNGNVRTAITSLDQIVRAGVKTAAEYMNLTGAHDSAPALMAALLTGDAARVFGTLDKQLEASGNPAHIASQLLECLRDLMVIRAGGRLDVSGTALDIRSELALRIEPERVFAACKVLWDLKTRIRVNDNPRGNLELALMLIADVFSRGKAQPAPVRTPTPQPMPVTVEPVTAPKKLTLADLQRSS